MSRLNYFKCNQCEGRHCTAKPNRWCGYIKLGTIGSNSLFENVVYKSSNQAEQVLTLLDKHGISW